MLKFFIVSCENEREIGIEEYNQGDGQDEGAEPAEPAEPAQSRTWRGDVISRYESLSTIIHIANIFSLLDPQFSDTIMMY